MALQKNHSLLLLLIAALSAAYSGSDRLLAYTNPLKGDIGVHDPVMIKQGSIYTVFYTGDFIPIKTSTDRITWKESGTVFKTCPKWFTDYVPENDGKNCWAPDISFRDGKYWLYYSVSTFGKRVSAIGLATAPTLDQSLPDYKWTDEGMIIRSTNGNDYNCIDPNLFTDVDGKVWLSFGSWNSGIKMVEINPKTGKLLSATPTLYSLARRSNTGTGIEAPFIIKRESYYYLFVSWDVCCKGMSSTYNIRIGRAPKITGPYTDSSSVAMNSGGGTLIDAGDDRWVGPGHNGIFIEHDTIFLVNHAYDAQKNGAPILMIRPFFWNKKGWPSIDSLQGIPTGAVPVHRPERRPPAAGIRPAVIFSCNDSRLTSGHKDLFTITGRRVFNDYDDRVVPGMYLIRAKTDERIKF